MSSHSLSRSIHTVAPWLERLARTGLAAKGVVHILVGALAARLALGLGGQTSDARGALRMMLGEPFGVVMLATIAIGLVGYAVWRLLQAALGSATGRGHSPGIAQRLAGAGTAIIYAGLGIEAARLAHGSAGESNGEAARHWTGVALGYPFGQAAVIAVGAGIAIYGAYQCIRAARSELSRDLSLGTLRRTAREWVVRISRFGIGARGVVFGIIGYLLIRAGLHRRAEEAEGIRGALDLVNGFGSAALLVIAFGLIAYGIYQLVNSRYRKIRVG
jgi:hypothetical protein